MNLKQEKPYFSDLNLKQKERTKREQVVFLFIAIPVNMFIKLTYVNKNNRRNYVINSRRKRA
jgi:hypothetical protein